MMTFGVDDFGGLVRVEARTKRADPLAVDSNIADEGAGGSDDVSALDDSIECHRWAPMTRLGGRRGQRAIENVESEINVFGRDAHRRLDAQDVTIEPAFADQHTHFAGSLEDGQRFLLRWLLRRSVTHQLDTEH